VIDPAVRLLKGVLERGRDKGEFKKFDIDKTVMVIIAPMLFFIMSKHSNALCLAGTPDIPSEDYISQHADLIVRGLSADTPV
jgi:TetR/AcrR family transcriptional regulator